MAYHLRTLTRRSIGISKPDPAVGVGARKLVAWCTENDAEKCQLLGQIAELELLPRKAAVLAIDKLIQVAASGLPVAEFYDEKSCHKTHSFDYKGKTRDIWRVRKSDVRVTFFYGHDKLIVLTHAFAKYKDKLTRAQERELEDAVKAFIDAETAQQLLYVEEPK
ncbi:type II toxin-antitoxin system RelE/ParE family toxin [Paraburkholderia sp. CNPSo 3272]|uniref:type II toxin-antitoxin system RelE/ParE family toxin n=1 Tax=Paraburkholderia sp. CNPSo 3272 TaxID=2940931 RepID=UPI0020B8C4C3|nr:type II toxin-antitoxin system RelE/ParE family toxin [Paraburkholderia sp. CNPSo 3272]MCP3722377.1 type II toxin-antitoxin system RelE/ParE family toxin [Paraburkholderia sp. CNPSo 3272]